jgi:type IV pilus assembly protein PilQ
MVRALLALVILCGTAAADRELCGPDTRYHGAPIDLDLRAATIHDVFRLIADVGHVNIVIDDSVAGALTLKLKRVPWDQAACVIAAVKQLAITVDGNVLIVRQRKPK